MPPLPNLIILFTRYPHPGKCKTRLIPTLGREGAAHIHRQLVSRTMETLTEFASLMPDTTYHIYYDGASASQMKQWLGDYSFRQQQGKDIGERMASALTGSLGTGQNCILIGSDCPDISPTLLGDAFQALQTEDLVLGPAHDGGYYLIGCNSASDSKAIEQLFKGITWSGDRVLATTLQRARTQQFSVHLLQKLHDIDTHDDLKYFHHYSHPE